MQIVFAVVFAGHTIPHSGPTVQSCGGWIAAICKCFFCSEKDMGHGMSRNGCLFFFTMFHDSCFHCADAAKNKHLTSAEIHAPMQTGQETTQV